MCVVLCICVLCVLSMCVLCCVMCCACCVVEIGRYMPINLGQTYSFASLIRSKAKLMLLSHGNSLCAMGLNRGSINRVAFSTIIA